MQKESKNTKFKIIGGYSLLLLLSILTTVLIYKQITHLIVNEETISQTNRKLYIVSSTITGLYEAEALSNAFIQTGSQNYFRKYLSITEKTESNIDTLRNLTSRVEQQLRLDTIANLLENKVRNLQDLAHVKKSFIPEEFYSKAIANIESGRDSSRQKINVVKRHVTTIDSSYVKTEKKKRRGLFSRATPDSTLKVSTIHHIIVDTLNNSLRNTDTVVNILKSTWEDVEKQKQTIDQQINKKEYALIQQSTDISDQLKTIINAYEKEEINYAYQKQETREQAITTMIQIFAWVAVIGFLLVIFFLFFILRDLSRSQRYRRELETANQYADQLLKSREKMILTVTHDIKSPLSSIIGYIELLNNTPTNDRQRYFLKNMRGSSEHILKLIGNLLDLSKLENNKMPIEEIVFNPAQLFQEISDNFLPLAAEKELILTSKFSKDLNQDYKGDALRIRQIITNILSNAVKYTNQGNINFTATTTTDDKQVVLKIEDTGSGMTPEEQKLIFQEFTRLKNHSAIEGTGLGLTITLKLIDLLEGHIKLESQSGKGSCFTIILPLSKSISSTSPVSTIPTINSNATDSNAPSDLKILLVDDDPLQLEMTQNLLAYNGIHSTTTTHPNKVIQYLQKQSYNLVFSDIQMPEMNGFELIKQIRSQSDDSVRKIPVIALSADADKTETDYLEVGFTAYLSKPFTANSLLQLIHQLTNIPLHIQSSESAVTTPESSQEYTLKNIQQFTDNDPEALKQIMHSFITSTREHIELLKKYLQEKQWKEISRVAHKMLPLFRQLEAEKIIKLLEELEHPELHSLTEEAQISLITQKVIQETKELIGKLTELYSME